MNGQETPVRPNLGLYTQPISFIGLPVVCVPVTAGALPCGVQIIAAPGREDLALAAATGWKKPVRWRRRLLRLGNCLSDDHRPSCDAC